jgi:probable F420-dependent oxidoreductase
MIPHLDGEIAMARAFRFGVQAHSFPAEGWKAQVQHIEALGYSSLFVPDHFSTQWEPVATLAAVAAATERLCVGSLVFDVDYRHPVVLAKASATTHLLSGGRHEFGIGAGWMESDYTEAGLRYDRAGVRIARLDEALQIIRSMWSQERTSFEGEHYRVREIAQAAELPAGAQPRILIGGGGPRVLRLAGRHADIVGINAAMVDGRVTADTPRDLAPARVREKVEWVREGAAAAGRDPDALELNSLVFLVAITDHASGLRDTLASSTGMSAEEVADCPLFLTGSGAEICERLEKRREQTGISYVVIQGADMATVEEFAEQVVAPLAGR